jgi:hypothetical protein
MPGESSQVDATTRRFVVNRAQSRCEYCQLPQSAVELQFHVEHITARQHGGGDDLDNLCLACDRCNLHKGPNLSGIDPQSQVIVALFNPRRDEWNSHFQLIGGEIVGRTPSGRATAKVLQMNSPRRRALRERLLVDGSW